ncbi:MAG: citrate synthase [Pseudomonadota bacterium]
MSDYLPGLEGVPATQSNISFIDGDQGLLAYRGYPIEQLARHSTFEETTMLLLDGRLPTADELAEFDSQLRRNRRVKFHIRELMKNLPASGHPMEMLQTSIASLGMFYPSNACLTGSHLCEDLDYIHRMTVKLLARIPVIVAMWQHIRKGYDPIPPREDLTTAENFLYMLHGNEPDPLFAEIMDTCLVLHAEHTINASTFAALVAGSTLASPYGVIASAVGTLSGPLHGGANEKVVDMLKGIGGPDNVESWLDEQLEKKAKIWGFGHREYSVKDPRANILQRLMEKLAHTKGTRHSALFDTALALEEAAEERLGAKGVYPNVDYYSGILYAEMGIPTDQFTPIFAISRAAGWLAHWREQLSDNRIFRPTQVYIGEPVRDYVTIDKR